MTMVELQRIAEAASADLGLSIGLNMKHIGNLRDYFELGELSPRFEVVETIVAHEPSGESIACNLQCSIFFPPGPVDTEQLKEGILLARRKVSEMLDAEVSDQ